MTPAQQSKIVGALVLAFPQARFSDDNAKVYKAFLADLDYELASVAVAGLVATSEFLPSIAKIRAACLDGRDGRARGAEDAWGDVVAEIRRVGTYGAPKFDDKFVGYAVARLGWRNLCGSTNDAADRARFCEIYTRQTEHERDVAVASPGLLASATKQLPEAVRGLLGGVGGK